jgi:hypothetical protein
MMVDTHSPFGIPGNFFISEKYNVKVVIDPNKNYFTNQIINDRNKYEKLLLIHGCEPPLLNDISSLIINKSSYFDKIYSYSNEVLEKCNNSEIFNFGSCWVLTNKDGNKCDLKKDYDNIFTTEKSFQVSFIKSGKSFLPGHKFRSVLEPVIRKKYNFDLFYPSNIPNKKDLFTNSMFHVVVENSQFDNYFTEKIIDCFMSYTIPIYWGCPNINNFFNPNGIITFNTPEELENILNNLSEKDYYDRLEALKENYQISYDKYAFFFDKVNDMISKI